MPYNPHRRALFAKGLKAARKRAGLSAQQAAALLVERGLGCTRGTLLAWERGVGPTTREPFASDLGLIAGVYGCTIGSFYHHRDGVEPPPPQQADGFRPPPDGLNDQNG